MTSLGANDKLVAISQSNYIPWKGYFNMIANVDEFVLLDDVQYTRRDWRNRNLVKTSQGLKWLTIPVDVKGRFSIKIKDVQTVNNDWRTVHWREIQQAYGKAPFFAQYKDGFEQLYLGSMERNLSIINFSFIRHINSLLNIKTPIRWSMEFQAPEGRNYRLIHICQALSAVRYLSGPAAKEYLDTELFARHGIEVCWAGYSNYPIYRQLYPPFEHGVSIVDLLFNEGPNSIAFFKQSIIL